MTGGQTFHFISAERALFQHFSLAFLTPPSYATCRTSSVYGRYTSVGNKFQLLVCSTGAYCRSLVEPLRSSLHSHPERNLTSTANSPIRYIGVTTSTGRSFWVRSIVSARIFIFLRLVLKRSSFVDYFIRKSSNNHEIQLLSAFLHLGG